MRNIVIALIIALIITASSLYILYRNASIEAKRQTENVANLIKEKDQILKITREEFEKSEAKWKCKIDSVIKAEGIKLNQVKSATVIQTVYRDTGRVNIIYQTPVAISDSLYFVQISYHDKCWGVAGTIKSSDKNAQLHITERSASNSAQLIVTRKRFLGFLWWQKGEQFRAYSDCGEVEFTNVTFVKK